MITLTFFIKNSTLTKTSYTILVVAGLVAIPVFFTGEGTEEAIEKLKTIPGNLVFETRWVGRKRIPSNVLGLLFHAAEHMQRHTGQLLVTAKVLRNSSK